MTTFLRRFFEYWIRVALLRAWAARRSLGVWCFALIWLMVLCMPFLRTAFQVQTWRTSMMTPALPWSNGKWPRAFSVERLHAIYPDDKNIELTFTEGEPAQLFNSSEDEEDSSNAAVTEFSTDDAAFQRILQRRSELQKITIQRYDTLMKRRPSDPVPVALWLRHTANNFRDNRVAGVLEDPSRSAAANPPFGPTSQPKAQPAPSYSQIELNQAIAVARKGQKLEPPNCFFDWTLIYFLLCARRDDEAIRVLDKASHKTTYDDHSCDLLAAFIRVRERVRPTLIEEKWAEVERSDFYFKQHRHIARLLSWIARKKDLKGDTRNALQIRGDLARITQIMGNGRNAGLWQVPSYSLSLIAWSRDLRLLSPSRSLRTTLQWRAETFALYATAHNRSDIARETQVFSQNIFAQRLLYRSYYGFFSTRVLAYVWLNVACLFSILLLLASYIWISVVLTRSPRVEVARRDVWCLLPFLALSALIGIAFLNTAIAQFPPTGYGALYLILQISQTLWMLAIGSVLFLTAPIFLNGLCCAISGWQCAKKAPGIGDAETKRSFSRTVLFFVWWSLVFYPIAYLVIAVVMRWNGVASWRIPLPVLNFVVLDSATWISFFVCFFFAVFLLMSWILYARGFSPPRTQNLYALRRFRQTLLALIPIYSAFWVAIALLSIPQRRLAETQLDDLLQHGEVYVAQHQSKYR